MLNKQDEISFEMKCPDYSYRTVTLGRSFEGSGAKLTTINHDEKILDIRITH